MVYIKILCKPLFFYDMYNYYHFSQNMEKRRGVLP